MNAVVRPAPRRAGTALILLTLLACGPSQQPVDAPEPSTAAKTFPAAPIILISIDTLRSDRLPAYGYELGKTPAIDALRRDGILFERAYSHVPLTLPAHASLFTGTLPATHGVRDNQGYPFEASANPHLPSLLASRGYTAAGAVSAYVLHRSTGFGTEGFELYDDAVDLRTDVALGGVARPGRQTLETLEPWLQERADEKFFLFLHLFEPHSPYQPPEPFASAFDSPYDGEIAAADAVVGSLIDLLQNLGAYDRSLIVLLSDHGEGLGDHGEEEHGLLLYREALQVPLIIKLPGAARSGEAVPEPVQLIDVAPSLLEAVGLPIPEAMEGQSLWRPRPDRGIYSETLYPRLRFGWSELTSWIEGDLHLIDGPDPELYDLVQDPGETRRLRNEMRREFADLRAKVAAAKPPFQSPAPVDEETRARLAALGYLGGSAPPKAGELPDPKSRLPSLAPLRRGMEHFRKGEIDRAIPELRAVLDENPGIGDAWRFLGDALFAQGKPEEALDAYGEALALAGQDLELLLTMADLQARLGRLEAAKDGILMAREGGLERPEVTRRTAKTLAAQGQLQAAVDLLEPLAREGHGLARVDFARLLSEGGAQEDALKLLSAIGQGAPESAEAQEVESLVLLRQSRWREAREAAQRAVELDPERAQGWNQLGVALYQLGERRPAVEAWARASALAPTDLDILYNLGTRAIEVGDEKAARQALERFLAQAPPARYQDDLRRARRLLRRLEGSR